MTRNPTQPPAGPETPETPPVRGPEIPGVDPGLVDLHSRRNQAKIDLGKAEIELEILKSKELRKHTAYITADEENEDTAYQEWKAAEQAVIDKQTEIDDLKTLIDDLTDQIDNFSPGGDSRTPENDHPEQNEIRLPEPEYKPQPDDMGGQAKPLPDGKPDLPVQAMPASMTEESSGPGAAAIPAPVVPPGLQPSPTTRANLSLRTATPDIDDGLPRLVRRDRQPLQPAEVLYPAMGYDQNVHEAWPEDAKSKATELYPDFPKWQAAIPGREPDSPDDLLDPDYFRLPSNPTFQDQIRHGIWKAKKAGQT